MTGQYTAETVYHPKTDPAPGTPEFQRRYVLPAISAVKARVPHGATLVPLEIPPTGIEWSEQRDGCRVLATWIPDWSPAFNAGRFVCRVDVAWA